MADYFSQEHLLRLLTRAPNATWRMDIDVSLDAAARMARFIADLAPTVRPTFYVAVVLETYNPFSWRAVGTLREVGDYGHRLGIHADVGDLDAPAGIAAQVATQGEALGWWLHESAVEGFRADLVSFHKPTAAVLWRDFEWFESAYASKWEGRYVSDSQRQWDAEKDARVSDDVQINLHPEHWFS